MKKKMAALLCLAMLLTMFVIPVSAADPVPRVTIDGQALDFDVAPMIDNGRVLVPLRAIFEQMGAKVDWDDSAKTATAVKGDITVVVKLGSTSPTINGAVKNIDVPAKLVEGGRILAPLRFVCEAFGGVVAWNPDTYVAAVKTTKNETVTPAPTEPAVPDELTLTLQQAVDLAVKNNSNVQLAAVDRDKKSKSSAYAARTARDLEDSYIESAFAGKRAIYLVPRIAERQKQQAEQVYEITINGVKIQAESAFYELIKARENEQIAANALQRADEQLRMANSKYAVGAIAKIEVIQNEAAQTAARAALTSAQSNSRQKMLELNKVIGLNMATIINPSGVFEFKAESYELQSLLDRAGKEAMQIITAQNNADIAQWNYQAYLDYYGSNNQDAQLAKEDVNAAQALLQQASNNIITTVNQTYANYKSLEEQYQYLLKAVELSREAYRLQKLSYDVGMTTFEDVQKSSDNLQKAEASLSECIFAYNTIKSSMKYSIYQ